MNQSTLVYFFSTFYPNSKRVIKKGKKNKRRKGGSENQRAGFIYKIIPVSTV
jgi:hypothetical protein